MCIEIYAKNAKKKLPAKLPTSAGPFQVSVSVLECSEDFRLLAFFVIVSQP